MLFALTLFLKSCTTAGSVIALINLANLQQRVFAVSPKIALNFITIQLPFSCDETTKQLLAALKNHTQGQRRN